MNIRKLLKKVSDKGELCRVITAEILNNFYGDNALKMLPISMSIVHVGSMNPAIIVTRYMHSDSGHNLLRIMLIDDKISVRYTRINSYSDVISSFHLGDPNVFDQLQSFIRSTTLKELKCLT